MACLARIIEFYDRTEPASPVPFLARRMLRMVPMDFLQLMEELAPSGSRSSAARRHRRGRKARFTQFGVTRHG